MLTQCSRQLYVSRRNSFRKILRHQQHQVVSSPGAAHVEHGAQVPDLLPVYLGQDDKRKRLREALGRFVSSGRVVRSLLHSGAQLISPSPMGDDASWT